MRLIALAIALICLVACSPPQQTVTIEFEARLGDEPIDCETVVDGVTMSDLRFFVTGPLLLAPRPDGTGIDPAFIEFTENGRWQQENLALIDLENGQGSCVNGTPDTNPKLVGRVADGDYQGLAFWLGVEPERNHADPLAAAPPLDDSTMHWHWRSGYKFMRAGFETEDDGFWMHVGSAGCEGTVQNITGCSRPNLVLVELPDFRPGDKVLFDFEALVAAVDIEDATPTDCSSGPGEEACREPFAVYGLDFDSGIPKCPEVFAAYSDSGNPDCERQQLFRAESP